MTTDTKATSEVYLDALAECKDVFANVYYETTTPYTLLSWGLSRVIGTEPKDHVPASCWHNALCIVSDRDVEDFGTWAKAAFDLHLSQLAHATEEKCKEAWRYQSCFSVSLPDLERETASYIDREIKRVYPTVRRNTKRYKELVTSVQGKARKLTAKALIGQMEAKRARLAQFAASDKQEADKVRAATYTLADASNLVLKLCPEQADELGTATRKMLDVRLAHASRIERRLTGDLETIDYFIAEMAEIERG